MRILKSALLGFCAGQFVHTGLSLVGGIFLASASTTVGVESDAVVLTAIVYSCTAAVIGGFIGVYVCGGAALLSAVLMAALDVCLAQFLLSLLVPHETITAQDLIMSTGTILDLVGFVVGTKAAELIHQFKRQRTVRTSDRAAQRALQFYGHFVRALGFSVYAASLVLFVASREPRAPFLFNFLHFICMAAGCGLGGWILRRGGRIVRASATPAHGEEADVLVLRSFVDDELEFAAAGFLVPRYLSLRDGIFLGFLASALSRVGKVVALGNPEEALPVWAEHWMYFDHVAWQKAVVDLMDNAKVVVVILGSTPSLQWEIGEALTRKGGRSLFVMPPDDFGRRSRLEGSGCATDQATAASFQSASRISAE